MEGSDDAVENRTERVQAIFEYRCADSRDRGSVERMVARAMVRWYRLLGIEIIRKSIIGAGVFATADVVDGIKRGMHRKITLGMEEGWWPFKDQEGKPQLRDPDGNPKEWTPMHFIIQVNTHADARLGEGADPEAVVYRASDVIFEKHSPINCGMGHAADVFRELMEFMRGRVEVRRDCSLITVEDNESMLEFLQQAYGFEGDSPEDFIKPIHDHEMHVTKQARKIANALANSFQLRDVDWTVNAGITNYRTGQVIRIDRNAEVHTIMDDIARMNAMILGGLPNSHPEKARRVEAQKPVALLLCSPNVDHPRNTLLGFMNGDSAPAATPGSVFALSGYDITGPTYPFGPYRVLSIFYALKHLGIRDVYLLAEGEGELNAMEVKVRRDPMVSLMLKEFGVNVHRINTQTSSRGTSTPPVDDMLRDALKYGKEAFFRKLHPKSPLNRLPERLHRASIVPRMS
ncbi:MAG: hypothetical protein AB1657_01810 [Candidatus Micrarchaeota archaeon]